MFLLKSWFGHSLLPSALTLLSSVRVTGLMLSFPAWLHPSPPCLVASSPRPSSALQTQLYSPNSVLSHHWGRDVPLCLPIGIALNRVGGTDAPHGKLTFI